VTSNSGVQTNARKRPWAGLLFSRLFDVLELAFQKLLSRYRVTALRVVGELKRLIRYTGDRAVDETHQCVYVSVRVVLAFVIPVNRKIVYDERWTPAVLDLLEAQGGIQRVFRALYCSNAKNIAAISIPQAIQSRDRPSPMSEKISCQLPSKNRPATRIIEHSSTQEPAEAPTGNGYHSR